MSKFLGDCIGIFCKLGECEFKCLVVVLVWMKVVWILLFLFFRRNKGVV